MVMAVVARAERVVHKAVAERVAAHPPVVAAKAMAVDGLVPRATHQAVAAAMLLRGVARAKNRVWLLHGW